MRYRSAKRTRKAREEAEAYWPLERYRHTGLSLPEAIAENLRAHNVHATPKALGLLAILYRPPSVDSANLEDIFAALEGRPSPPSPLPHWGRVWPPKGGYPGTKRKRH